MLGELLGTLDSMNVNRTAAKNLLLWYDSFGRSLPWREEIDPYRIWISEILLQQTRVAQGLGYYNRFIQRFGTVESLAEASLDEVLLYWKGLGYYSRAKNLHKAAQKIVEEYKGHFPESYKEILSLPGIGPYTASAISSICFGESRASIDGNLYRVLSRYYADSTDIGSSRAFKHFSTLALELMPKDRPGAFNQALMDIGSQICTPKSPKCGECPLAIGCVAYATGTMSEFPKKERKVKVKKLQIFYHFLYNDKGFVVRRRGEEDIWKNLYEFVSQLPCTLQSSPEDAIQIAHKLSHRDLFIEIQPQKISNEELKLVLNAESSFNFLLFSQSNSKSFPRPLDVFLEKWIQSSAD